MEAGPEEFIGEHPLTRRLTEVFRQVGRLDTPVLLVGEGGTGKRSAARAIHAASSRAQSPFRVAQRDPAVGRRLDPDVFLAAAGGTVVIDEVGETTAEEQERLLGVLERGEVQVLATSRTPLSDRVESGGFREDLFRRLSEISITIPALRERRSDIPLLVRHFLSRHEKTRGVPIRVEEDAMVLLWEYDWPGNVPELVHVIEGLLERASGGVVALENLPPSIRAFRESKRVAPRRTKDPRGS
jgi:two-component system, NtrC family, nitrogen regulation response regulator GlnG